MKAALIKRPSELNNHAIVIGGSIAGMLAARVLADKFDAVTIIERDKLPEKPDARKGVPQSVQPHVLFTKGYRILEELFPGIGAELLAAGAIPVDWAREFYHFGHGRWNSTADSASDVVSFFCSRPLLEWAIRQRLLKLSKVRFIEQSRVTGLLCNADKTHVRGVAFHSIGSCIEEKLLAELVVDASGRKSQAPYWLESLGFTPPKATVVDPLFGYATRRYQIPQGFQADWKVMLIQHSPPSGTRLGFLAQVEGGEWIATLGGYGQDYPPLDDEGFMEYAHSLSSPRLYEAIKDARPTSRIHAYRATANRMYHYEKVRLPEGFVVLGDAVCALCPAYGQGMTVSALSAMVLRDWLCQQDGKFPFGNFMFSSLQKQLARSNSFAWANATVQDSRFLTTKGRIQPRWIDRLMQKYKDWLMQKANEEPQLKMLALEVTHLIKPQSALFHPRVMLRTISTALKPPRGGKNSGSTQK